MRNDNEKEINENSFINIIKVNKNESIKNIKRFKNSEILMKYIIFFIFLFLLVLLNLIYLNINVRNMNLNLKEIINGYILREHYTNNDDYNILDEYKKAQNDFCDYPDKYINKEYEKEIILSNVKFNSINTKMFLPKSNNRVIFWIEKDGVYEGQMTNSILEALKFYSYKKNIRNNKDIIMLDIGGNVGWYPSILGRYNYTIISFEPVEKNNYISKKNYCYLNKNSNVYIVTKGLGIDNQICNYFNQNNNTINGMSVCQKKNILNDNKLNQQFTKIGEVEITTLNSFIPFLSKKNVALIKIDVEGNEFRIIEGGKELITKYHVPFVVLEFTPNYLKELDSDPEKLIQFFINNGYKISINGFLSKNYITKQKLFKIVGNQINCYFIHSSIL